VRYSFIYFSILVLSYHVSYWYSLFSTICFEQRVYCLDQIFMRSYGAIVLSSCCSYKMCVLYEKKTYIFVYGAYICFSFIIL
jgi:hypothetical protein